MRIVQALLLIFIIAGALNFFVFFVNAVAHGGDAINGKVENGHYYFGSHGTYTMVSREDYEKSKLHVYSIWITWPFVMAAAYCYNRIKRPKRLI